MNLDALQARLAEKRIALEKSDAAINALTDLIVAAANGEATNEHGVRLSITEAVKGAEALRQVHAILSNEVADLERRIASEKRRIAYESSPSAKRLAALITPSTALKAP
ncbi:hypothetical protein ACT80S_06445 [Ramlibacter sp. MAHUQ-53]|uniref:hypothetical protein n=1 Tax=unclassified Ramlibacter TaxID=2617605 RepID=UPI003625F9D6